MLTLKSAALRVRKLFRPENTSFALETSSTYSYNLVFWSSDFAEVACEGVEGVHVAVGNEAAGLPGDAVGEDAPWIAPWIPGSVPVA